MFYDLNGFSHRSHEAFSLHEESVNHIRIHTELGITYNAQNRLLTLKNIDEMKKYFNDYYKEK
ncbi:hypothetical protein [Paenibacillus andongensis]|uniref:hypothetical protein n=1 Tax=Paenibacillus andongensis TaxID=2975482 RepID=UPI0021BB1852|nr:hypothetical protein [Paenibacillus andongensis]